MSDIFKTISRKHQSEFDRRYACWANNHNGWRKMKRLNRKRAKKRVRRLTKIETEVIANERDSIYYFGERSEI